MPVIVLEDDTIEQWRVKMQDLWQEVVNAESIVEVVDDMQQDQFRLLYALSNIRVD